jgi:hypothetical protein
MEICVSCRLLLPPNKIGRAAAVRPAKPGRIGTDPEILISLFQYTPNPGIRQSSLRRCEGKTANGKEKNRSTGNTVQPAEKLHPALQNLVLFTKKAFFSCCLDRCMV